MPGRPWSHSLGAAALLLIALQSVGACNSILDIQQAELGEVEQTGGACLWPIPDPTVECSQCEGCAGKCPTVDRCLADRDCRTKLAQYRKCVGDSCADPGHHCDGCTKDNALAAETATCLASCNCNLARVTTLCEDYCACMDSRCHDNEPGGSMSSCLSACVGGQIGLQLPKDRPDPAVEQLWHNPPSASLVYCFLTHCDRSDIVNDPLHCAHAVGQQQPLVCPEVQERGSTVCSVGQGYGNAPCNIDADCCSQNCDSNNKTCIGP